MGGLRGYFKWMTDGSYLGDTPQSIQRARHTALTTHKDLQAALELADSLGVDLPIARLVEERADSFVEIDPQSGERRRPKRVPAVSS
jgi:3-hydroxyisobutyrate dehydrogenase-like beta-hydroxyacid dehydrogenase